MDFENLDATASYELVIEERYDPEKVNILRKAGITARANTEENVDRVRALTIAQSFQAWPAIQSAVLRDAQFTNCDDALLSDFNEIDPPYMLTPDCDGRAFIAFLDHAREAQFDNGTPYFNDFVVKTLVRTDENGHKATEYYVFGVMGDVKPELQLERNSSELTRNWFLLSHFGVEGVLPIREILQRQEQRNLMDIQRKQAKAISTRVTEEKRAQSAEKAIAAYQNRKRSLVVRESSGGAAAVLGAGGIVLFGLATLWFTWVILGVLVVIYGVRGLYVNDQRLIRAVRRSCPQLERAHEDQIRSVIEHGYYIKPREYYDDPKEKVYVDIDPRLMIE